MAEAGEDCALVVEDDPIVRSLLEWQLGQLGFRVVGVGSVDEARAALGGRRFSVLALDDVLPDGTAADVLKHLPSPTPRVLMCSGRRSLTLPGVDAWVSKPFSLDELRRALSALTS